jgi:hypothetical protein
VFLDIYLVGRLMLGVYLVAMVDSDGNEKAGDCLKVQQALDIGVWVYLPAMTRSWFACERRT